MFSDQFLYLKDATRFYRNDKRDILFLIGKLFAPSLGLETVFIDGTDAMKDHVEDFTTLYKEVRSELEDLR